MATELLCSSGLYLGAPDQLLAADKGNLHGHFEHVGFLKINNAVLEHFDASWDDPPQFESGWERDVSLTALVAEARELLDSFAGKLSWGWKEPRTTILLPFWKAIIPDLRFVICVRNPLDVARSLSDRNGMPIERGVFLWTRYMRDAINDTKGYARLVIFYEDFFEDAIAQISKLLEFCGLSNPGDLSSCRDNVVADLRHHRSDIADLLDYRSIPIQTKLLFLGIRTLTWWKGYPGRSVDDLSKNLDLNKLLKLVDDLHNEANSARLQMALAKKEHELANLLVKTRDEILGLKTELSQLQDHADRLQAFSDAVRQTFAYRFYRKLIRPLKGY